VAHAVSVSYSRSDRMSPSAMGLAALLHALVVLALWGISLNRPEPPREDAIDVTIEQPKLPEKPPQKPPEPPAAPTPKAPPVTQGLRPPAEMTAEKPTQVPTPPTQEQPRDPLPPKPPSVEQVVPPPPPQTPPPPSTAVLEPPKPEPPAPLPAPSRPPEARALAVPPPAKPNPPVPQPPIRPSPLTPQRQQPRPDVQAARPAPSPFVNPADVYNRARVADNYLWQVVRKLEPYHFYAQVNARQGTTVIRVVIARNGRLLEAEIAQSSGFPAIDKGILDGVRGGSPYAPLPPEIQGDRATFSLPLTARYRP
jgi:TonB family protein